MRGRNAVATHASPTTPSVPAIALMYHALAGVDDRGHDPHYTLGAEVFRQHLASIRALAGAAGSARDWLDEGADLRAVLTFDDGHVSNHRLALPLLLEFGMRADFFVNPATVGQPGFVSWADLREMAAAGMSIQSHGYDHQYLTDLPPQRLRDSLSMARLEIEDRLGTPVTLLAPPGGRMPAGLALTATACGYARVFASRPGRLRARDPRPILPRMAVTAQCDDRTVQRWLSGNRAAIWRLQWRYRVLAAAKWVLGNALYERARSRALPGPGASA